MTKASGPRVVHENIGAPTAGRITGTLVDNRILQMALKLEF